MNKIYQVIFYRDLLIYTNSEKISYVHYYSIKNLKPNQIVKVEYYIDQSFPEFFFNFFELIFISKNILD